MSRNKYPAKKYCPACGKLMSEHMMGGYTCHCNKTGSKALNEELRPAKAHKFNPPKKGKR